MRGLLDFKLSHVQGPNVERIAGFELSMLTGGRDAFGGRSSADQKGAALVHLAVIPPAESWHLHVLAVTADGRRVFCTTRVRPIIATCPQVPASAAECTYRPQDEQDYRTWLVIIPPAESWHLHVLAVTAGSRRVLCTTRVRALHCCLYLRLQVCSQHMETAPGS